MSRSFYAKPFKRGCVVLLVIVASACGGSNPLPSAPSTPTVGPTSTFHVTGIATEDDRNPVAGANITVQPWVDSVQKSVPPMVVATDGAGFYRLDCDANRDAGGFAVMLAPEQRLLVRTGRVVLQSRVAPGSEQKTALVRVFVDVDRVPAEVVTVYATSKIGKYWNPSDED